MKKNKKFFQRFFYLQIKTFFDFLFALIFLILGLPFFIIIFLLIKLSSRGPIFFSQKRIGQNNKYFYCLKFRTMHPEAEDILENIISKNKDLREEFQLTHKLKNDLGLQISEDFLKNKFR